MANYTTKAQRAADTAETLAIMEFSRSLRGIQQADQLSALVWIFCMRCGHSKLTSPRWLVAQVKGAPDVSTRWRGGCGASAAPRRASS